MINSDARAKIAFSQSPPPGMSTASSSKQTSTSANLDIEKLLSREASAFQRELEVERILKAFKFKSVPFLPYLQTSFDVFSRSPYDILDIDELATPEDIKRKYRQISLCALSSQRQRQATNPTPSFSVIHPDKCPHARAPEAFDILKKVCLKPSLLLFGPPVHPSLFRLSPT
jgi:DnaJ family protein C protein 8